MSDIKDRMITLSLMESFKFSYAPSVTFIMNRIGDMIDREGYDVIYKEHELNVTEEEVHSKLKNDKACHSYRGDIYFDAQNILFDSVKFNVKMLEGFDE